jgi:exopolyphosphatase/guanosine-5'-triphosphate,3'-diphosphate pyrophosphatase
MSHRCAAIDFGTNTARLLIAERVSGHLVPLHCQREIVRLGGGFTRELGLSVEAQQRGLSCLKRFAEILASYEITKVHASATSAVRDALNGPSFVDEVRRQTGIVLNVISGEREGQLTLRGVISGLDILPENMVIVDIGGGSTECTVAQNGVPLFVRSMPIGVVRLTEGFASPYSMKERIDVVTGNLADDLLSADIAIRSDSVMIATAGTATTLAAIKMEMKDYDYRLVNNFVLSRQDIYGIYQRLLPLQPDERLEVAGMEAGREDLIISGMLIILRIMEMFGFETVKVSDYGLLEGLALSDD